MNELRPDHQYNVADDSFTLRVKLDSDTFKQLAAFAEDRSLSPGLGGALLIRDALNVPPPRAA